jgi:hypothetical protein
MLAGEGLFEAVDGIDLAIAQAAREESWKFLKAGPERVFLLNQGRPTTARWYCWTFSSVR